MSETSMIINYVPGEECRVAITADGNLEELHAERTDAVSRVNNIYVGKVMNVEAGIQAAFVDFGLEENGFLHISDLHPRYFVEDDATERVGKKTPRRERPPIQACLKRGQEIIVQVLKEGVGTKGPTLTSYLSIPGRYLVMMPNMDKVGVSRKVDDEEQRTKMKEILGQLELPDGFGFILRTAGFDRTKTDLKRDLAYLQRLWKNMEINRKAAGKRTRLLYSESDLLVRALRDLVTPDITRIIIDEEGAVTRAAQFMKIVSPRSTVKVMRYKGGRPIFHAFGIEQQIATTHAREVPLPSGGRLVIDETEAIVAIDVNSGKSRAARDAETNAYKTNVEAVEVICRQIRLRDLGGIVINDLIDMRSAAHRKAIEQLFRDRLKRDRAKSSIAPISPFGILEMTRQRMRGSLSSQHYSDCPTCRGKGLVQKPHSVSSDAMREIAVLMEHDKVGRVELVVSGRVAGELLSNRRGSLNRLERSTGKQVEVRVSETLALDRYTIYAYDKNGVDIDPDKLSKPKSPEADLEVVVMAAKADQWAVDPQEQSLADELAPPPGPDAPTQHPIEQDFDEDEPEPGEGGKKKRRRRRGGRRRKSGGSGGEAASAEGDTADSGAETVTDAEDTATAEPAQDATEDGADDGSETDAPKKKRRRRRRRRGGGGMSENGDRDGARDGDGAMESEAVAPKIHTDGQADTDAGDADARTHDADEQPDVEGSEAPKKKSRRRRGRRGSGSSKSSGDAQRENTEPRATEVSGQRSEPVDGRDEPTEPPADSESEGDGNMRGESEQPKKKRRRSRSKKASTGAVDGATDQTVANEGSESDTGESVGERADEGATKIVKKKRRRRPSGDKAPADGASAESAVETKPARDGKASGESAKTPAKQPRTLYGSTRRKLAPSDHPSRPRS
ncbi:MAG: Rne/Rng family ribonuclease [Planctomycetota bacterium]|nr:Rne/Rng family ribonuclease [Planctomycetota bacterium]